MAFEDRQQRAEFQFTPGVPVVFNLNPGLKILKGNIIIQGTVTLSGVTNPGQPIGEGGAINLIRRIRVIANKAAGSRYPNGALVNCSPQTLLRYAITEHQGKFVGELTGNGALGGGANGVYPIFLSIPIYFGDSTLLNNVQTALNMDLKDSQGNAIYSAVQVQVELAAGAGELFFGNNGEMTVAATVRWADDRLALQTDTIPLVQEDHYALIMAAQEEFVDAAMPQDGAFTTWLILAQQGGPEFVLSNALLNRLRIQGTGLNYRENGFEIQQAMLDNGFYDPSQSLVGQYHLDWTKGLLGNSNAAAGLQAQFSVNNPSGAGLDRLRVYTRRVYGLA
jgi:hypothetical protein